MTIKNINEEGVVIEKTVTFQEIRDFVDKSVREWEKQKKVLERNKIKLEVINEMIINHYRRW